MVTLSQTELNNVVVMAAYLKSSDGWDAEYASTYELWMYAYLRYILMFFPVTNHKFIIYSCICKLTYRFSLSWDTI